MIKKIIYSLVAIVLVAFITTIKPSFVSADENSTDLVIEIDIDDDIYDNMAVVRIKNNIYINDAEGNPYTGKVVYKINDEEEGELSFKDGVGNVNVQGGHNVITIKGLRNGYTYKVDPEEACQTKLIMNITNSEGTIVEEGNNVKVAATIYTYDLEFIMHISGIYDDFEVPVHFHANRYNSYPIPREGFTYELVRDGKIIKTGQTELTEYQLYLIDSIWLKDGDRLIIKGMADMSGVGFVGKTWYRDNDDFGKAFLEKYGIRFTKYFWDAYMPDSYMFDNQERRVVHLNLLTYYHYLVFSKKYNGEGIEKDKEFTFKVRGYVPSVIESDLEYPITGKYPYTKYTVTEEVDPKNPEKTITKKEVVDTGTLEFDETGIGYIKLKAGEYVNVGENPEYVDEEGNLNGGYSFYMAKLLRLINHCFPNDAIFEITEENSEGYNVEVNDETNYDAQGYTYTYVLQNTRKFTGKLTINKKVSGNDADKNKEFNFKIKLEDGADDIPMTYKYTGSKEGELEFDENFEATITLKDGESITIEGLPVGAKYTVEEDDYSEEGYTTTVVGGTGTIKDGDTETVTASFTNHKNVDTIEDVPKTGDKIGSWLIMMIISILGIVSTLYVVKRRYLKA